LQSVTKFARKVNLCRYNQAGLVMQYVRGKPLNASTPGRGRGAGGGGDTHVGGGGGAFGSAEKAGDTAEALGRVFVLDILLGRGSQSSTKPLYKPQLKSCFISCYH
jgi:hypothetical protein